MNHALRFVILSLFSIIIYSCSDHEFDSQIDKTYVYSGVRLGVCAAYLKEMNGYIEQSEPDILSALEEVRPMIAEGLESEISLGLLSDAIDSIEFLGESSLRLYVSDLDGNTFDAEYSYDVGPEGELLLNGSTTSNMFYIDGLISIRMYMLRTEFQNDPFKLDLGARVAENVNDQFDIISEDLSLPQGEVGDFSVLCLFDIIYNSK